MRKYYVYSRTRLHILGKSRRIRIRYLEMSQKTLLVIPQTNGASLIWQAFFSRRHVELVEDDFEGSFKWKRYPLSLCER